MSTKRLRPQLSPEELAVRKQRRYENKVARNDSIDEYINVYLDGNSQKVDLGNAQRKLGVAKATYKSLVSQSTDPTLSEYKAFYIGMIKTLPTQGGPVVDKSQLTSIPQNLYKYFASFGITHRQWKIPTATEQYPFRIVIGWYLMINKHLAKNLSTQAGLQDFKAAYKNLMHANYVFWCENTIMERHTKLMKKAARKAALPPKPAQAARLPRPVLPPRSAFSKVAPYTIPVYTPKSLGPVPTGGGGKGGGKGGGRGGRRGGRLPGYPAAAGA